MHEPTSPPYEPLWGPPDPATRYGSGPPPAAAPRRPGRRHPGWVSAVVVILGLLFGLVGYAAIDHRSGSSSPPLATSAPPATRPPTPGRAPRATAPTTPPTTEPGSAGSGVSASTTALNVGVVDVNTELGYQRSAAAGTGIVLSASGEILTNNHVIA